jgi:hypothetical protein
MAARTLRNGGRALKSVAYDVVYYLDLSHPPFFAQMPILGNTQPQQETRTKE